MNNPTYYCEACDYTSASRIDLEAHEIAMQHVAQDGVGTDEEAEALLAKFKEKMATARAVRGAQLEREAAKHFAEQKRG